tara:strand:- start:354 stop:608 length:255 start_codon:yes stop_codon:yes gene_type:complete
MKTFIKDLEKKLKENINILKIETIDNSEKHKNHKSFVKNKVHLMLKIKSDELKSLSQIEAHRKIMKVLSTEMKSQIHALQIKIE